MRLLIPSLLLCAGVAQAADICVGPSATGSGSGANWTNLAAWSGTPARGDTWYLADGNYGGKNLGTAASGSTLITIKKATVVDHGPSTGWVNTMGDGQAVFSSSISFDTPHWVFDGVTGGGPIEGWTNGFGFKINSTGTTYPEGSGIYVLSSSGVSNVILRHFEIEGGGPSAIGPNRGVTFGEYVSDFTVSYAYIHDTFEVPLYSGADNVVFEYVYTGRYYGNPDFHAVIISSSKGSGPWTLLNNLTFRYCVFTWCNSTGGIMFAGSNLSIYGCVFVRVDNSAPFDYSDGAIGVWANKGIAVNDYKIYNCSFIDFWDNGSSPGTQTFQDGGSSVGTMDVRNCLFYKASLGFGTFTHSYNTYITPFSTGTSFSGEAQGKTNSTVPWVNYTALNFQLYSNTAAGTNLGAPYDTDMFGRTRVTWTRGAIEYASLSISPQNLTVTNAQVIQYYATNNLGANVTDSAFWTSSIPAAVSINHTSGVAEALIDLGVVEISATWSNLTATTTLIMTNSRTYPPKISEVWFIPFPSYIFPPQPPPKVTWVTDKPATTELTTTFCHSGTNITILDTNLVTFHTVNLVGCGSPFSFSITATDAGSNTSPSSAFSGAFALGAPPVRMCCEPPLFQAGGMLVTQ